MKKALKVLMILCFAVGIGLVGYSVYEIASGAMKVEQKKVEAKQLLREAANNQKEKMEKGEVDPEEITYDQGQTIGILSVPKLKRELPIVEGTDEYDLLQGVGHYSGTALPLQNEQIVLSGHRETVFRGFDKLNIGDIFVVELPYGSFEYEIYETEIVDADDRTVIRPRGEEILTVTTCYPFTYIGDAPNRFIFYAKPVNQNNEGT
ncbi:class D sortase [Bacillus kwashiorkori]|uniref:class D sortase n=1 Tax=Bacillus kwashiorkori TaxID=1522318 RepID=UPI000783C1E9|nr:class D sortase [Bacillus kwashiorkori]